MPPGNGRVASKNDNEAMLGWRSGFVVSDQDVGSTSYYGYLNEKGEYYFMRAVRTGSTTAYRFYIPTTAAQKAESYVTAWADKSGGSKTYDYYDVVFK